MVFAYCWCGTSALLAGDGRLSSLSRNLDFAVLRIAVSYQIGWLNHVFLKQNGWNPKHRRWQSQPFWDTSKLPLLNFPAYDAQKRVEELYTAFPLLQWRRGAAPRLSHQILKQLRWGETDFEESFITHCPQRQKEQCAPSFRQLFQLDSINRRNSNQKLHITTQQLRAIGKLKYFSLYKLPLEAKAKAEMVSANDMRLVRAVIQRHEDNWSQAVIERQRRRSRGGNIPQELASQQRSKEITSKSIKHETVLQLVHAPLMLTAFLKRAPMLAPLAGVIAAAAYTMRTHRTWRELQDKRIDFQLPNEREEHTLIYNVLFNAVAVPVALWGGNAIGKLLGRAKRASWRAWRHLSWREKMANLDFVTSFSLSRLIDTKAHMQRKENPLKSKNFVINSGYNVLGAFLNRQALVTSGTWRGRLAAMFAISAAYSYGNIYVQEIQGLFGDGFSGRQIQWDNQWGTFHSSPRNLMDSTLWNLLVKAKVHPAIVTTIKGADGIQRKIWYSNSKLSYLRDDYSYLEAMWDIQPGDYLP